MLNIIYLILLLASFLLTFKFIVDSNFEKLFKKGKTRTILVAAIFVSLIGGYLISTSIYKIIELFIVILK
jgi:uncharacterized membrane protein YwzB